MGAGDAAHGRAPLQRGGRLRDLLCLRFRGVVIPPLPPKSRSSALQQKDLLQLFLQHVVGCPSEVLEEAFLTRFLQEDEAVFRSRTMPEMDEMAKAIQAVESPPRGLRQRTLDAFSRSASLVPFLSPQPPRQGGAPRPATYPWREVAAAASGMQTPLQQAVAAYEEYLGSARAFVECAERCRAVLKDVALPPPATGLGEDPQPRPTEEEMAIGEGIRDVLGAMHRAATQVSRATGGQAGVEAAARVCHHLRYEARGLEALAAAARFAHDRHAEAQRTPFSLELQERLSTLEGRLAADVRQRVLPQLAARVKRATRILEHPLAEDAAGL
eukprot:gene12688-biopygen9328